MWMRRGPDDRAAAVWFRGVAIAQSDAAPIFVKAPADIRGVEASRLGLVAALRDHTLVCWSWDGAMRWRTAPIDALHLRVAMSDNHIVVLADGRLFLVENDGQLLRPTPRPPRENAWDSWDVSAVGIRANRIYAAIGSACARLDVKSAFSWSPRIASDDFLATVLRDVSGELVGFAGGSSATIFGIDGAAQTITTARRVVGAEQQNAALSHSRMLIHGHTKSCGDAADIIGLQTQDVTHQFALSDRARIVGAWFEGTDACRLVGGQSIFAIALG